METPPTESELFGLPDNKRRLVERALQAAADAGAEVLISIPGFAYFGNKSLIEKYIADREAAGRTRSSNVYDHRGKHNYHKRMAAALPGDALVFECASKDEAASLNSSLYSWRKNYLERTPGDGRRFEATRDGNTIKVEFFGPKVNLGTMRIN